MKVSEKALLKKGGGRYEDDWQSREIIQADI
jgi:hypothetical protein